MTEHSKYSRSTGEIRLLDLALDADYPAHPSRALIAGARRANKSGKIFMCMARWAYESGIKIATLRKYRDQFVRDGILIDEGKRRNGARIFRFDAARLAERLKRPFRETVSGPIGESPNGPQNLNSESKEKAAARSPAGAAKLAFENECQISTEIRGLLKLKFAFNASKFDCLLHFDDPILRLVTVSAVDAIWLREHVFAIQKLIREKGFAITEVVVEVASRRTHDP